MYWDTLAYSKCNMNRILLLVWPQYLAGCSAILHMRKYMCFSSYGRSHVFFAFESWLFSEVLFLEFLDCDFAFYNLFMYWDTLAYSRCNMNRISLLVWPQYLAGCSAILHMRKYMCFSSYGRSHVFFLLKLVVFRGPFLRVS